MKTGDIEVLNDAQAANPHWTEAMMLAAAIMAERRRKWSGRTNPYTNFIKWAQAEHIPVERTFQMAQTLKMTRDQEAEAQDDSLIDNGVDKANYALLETGWRLLSPVEKLAYMLEVGVWIDSSLIADWTLVDDGEAVP